MNVDECTMTIFRHCYNALNLITDDLTVFRFDINGGKQRKNVKF